MSAISLKKGQKVSLKKSDGTALVRAKVELGWVANAFDGKEFDLDASAFALGLDNKLPRGVEDFIYYDNEQHDSGSIKSMGDNLVGGTEANSVEEEIQIDFSKVPVNINKVSIAITIYEAIKRAQNFGQVTAAFVRIVDADTQDVLVQYDLEEDFSIETAIVAGDFYRHNDEWKFAAIGAGFEGGLAKICAMYGLNVDSE